MKCAMFLTGVLAVLSVSAAEVIYEKGCETITLDAAAVQGASAR